MTTGLKEQVERDVKPLQCTTCGTTASALEFVNGLGDLECPQCGAAREQIVAAGPQEQEEML